MEYASPVRHSNLTKGQTKTLEDVQRQAVQIISGNIPYEEACRLLNQIDVWSSVEHSSSRYARRHSCAPLSATIQT